MAERADPPTEAHGVPFREAARFWVKLGFINFGGPTGQISIMHEEIVERRRWISNGRFLHALNYCMLLPGPEAQQLAIYVGWLLHKVKGGLVAGIAFVLPSFFVMLFLSWLYVVHGEVTWVSATLSGLAAAVKQQHRRALLAIDIADKSVAGRALERRGGGQRWTRHVRSARNSSTPAL